MKSNWIIEMMNWMKFHDTHKIMKAT